MAEYQLIADSTTVLRTIDSAYIPDDPANRDRAEYNQWLAEGNVPDPAPAPPEPPPPEPVQLPAQPEAPMDAATKSYVDFSLIEMVTFLADRIAALEAKLA